jgi:hypothetical protein
VVSDQAGVSYHNDDHGRMDSATDGTKIAYNELGLPIEIDRGSLSSTFKYDGLHARVLKSGPLGTTVSIGGIYELRHGSGGDEEAFLVEGTDGATVAQVVYDGAAGADSIEFLLSDRQVSSWSTSAPLTA